MEDFLNHTIEATETIQLSKAMKEFVDKAVKNYAKYELGLMKSMLLRHEAKTKKEGNEGKVAEFQKLKEELTPNMKKLEEVKKNGLESELFKVKE